MNQERDQARTHSDPSAPTHEDDLAPGRGSRAAQMAAPASPIAGGLLQRKARDANGVADGAEAAVGRAASSTGQLLPVGVRARFEQSTGTDLSEVRIHTGNASAEAAHAVGAHAYTVGQDIHFAAGKYAPSDPSGLHLLAHEVVHTIQQRGAAPTRQNKLEVSAPHDAPELEADRAADAMVAGAPTPVGNTAISRQIARDYRTDLDKAADEGGDLARAAGPDRVLGISTVKDKSEATSVHGMITSYQGEMQQALVSGDAKAFQLTTNNEALNTLNELMGAASAQDVGISNFKVLYKNVQVGYARLNAMAAKAGSGLGDKNAGSGVSAASGKELAKDHIDNAARSNGGTSAVAARAQKLAAMPGNQELAVKLKAVQRAEDPLGPQVAEVVTSQSQATNSVQKITGATARLRGLDAAFKSAELKAQYEAAKAEVEKTNKSVEGALETLIDITKTAVEKGPAGVAASYAEKLAPKIAVMVAAAAGVPGLTLTPQDAAKDKESEVEADKAKLDQYTAARNQLQTTTKDAGTTLTAFMNKVALLDQKQQEHKKALDDLGAALDAAEARQGKKTKPGETGTFQTITTFLGEADNFLADAKAARDVGQKDLSRGESGSTAQLAAAKQHRAGSLLVYIPNAWVRQPEGPRRFNVSQQRINLDFGGKDSADDSKLGAGDGGMSTISAACAAIDTFMKEIEAYRQELRASLGC